MCVTVCYNMSICKAMCLKSYAALSRFKTAVLQPLDKIFHSFWNVHEISIATN